MSAQGAHRVPVLGLCDVSLWSAGTLCLPRLQCLPLRLHVVLLDVVCHVQLNLADSARTRLCSGSIEWTDASLGDGVP